MSPQSCQLKTGQVIRVCNFPSVGASSESAVGRVTSRLFLAGSVGNPYRYFANFSYTFYFLAYRIKNDLSVTSLSSPWSELCRYTSDGEYLYGSVGNSIKKKRISDGVTVKTANVLPTGAYQLAVCGDVETIYCLTQAYTGGCLIWFDKELNEIKRRTLESIWPPATSPYYFGAFGCDEQYLYIASNSGGMRPAPDTNNNGLFKLDKTTGSLILSAPTVLYHNGTDFHYNWLDLDDDYVYISTLGGLFKYDKEWNIISYILTNSPTGSFGGVVVDGDYLITSVVFSAEPLLGPPGVYRLNKNNLTISNYLETSSTFPVLMARVAGPFIFYG